MDRMHLLDRSRMARGRGWARLLSDSGRGVRRRRCLRWPRRGGALLQPRSGTLLLRRPVTLIDATRSHRVGMGRTGGPRIAMHRPAIRVANRWRSGAALDATVIPVVAIAVERAAAIVVVPVGSDREADDRDADLRTVSRQQYRLVLIFVFDVVAGHPAAISVDDHIAPFPAIGAALHIHFGAGGNPVDQ